MHAFSVTLGALEEYPFSLTCRYVRSLVCPSTPPKLSSPPRPLQLPEHNNPKMSSVNSKIPTQSLIDTTRRVPPPDVPLQSGPPENRPSAKMPPSRAAHPSIIEVLSLRPPIPPPPPPIDEQSEREEVPLSPSVVREEPKADRGGAWPSAVRSEHEEAMVVVNLSNREETTAVTRVEGARSWVAPSTKRRSRREEMVRKAALGFRVLGIVFCLISFSVMAADKTQGWAGDSFERYKEYRYFNAKIKEIENW